MASPIEKDEPRERLNDKDVDLLIGGITESIDEGKMSVGEGAQFFDHPEDRDKP